MARTWAEAREKYWGAPIPEGLKHGSNTWVARVYGCGCSTCLPSGQRIWKNVEGATGPLSGTERRRRSREKLYGQPVPDDVKHGIYTYQVYGCRCPACMEAKNGQNAKRQNAWRKTARGRWLTSKDETGAPLEIICWPPANAGPDWTCPDPTHKET